MGEFKGGFASLMPKNGHFFKAEGLNIG